MCDSKTWLMEPLLQERSQNPFLVDRSVVRPESDTVPVRLLNLSAEPVTVYKGKKMRPMLKRPCPLLPQRDVLK